MNAFLDTNVIIGYIYSLDPLHAASQKAIVDKNANYYSFHVNKEINDVSQRKDREYAKFLTKLEDIFNKYGDYDLIDLAEIHIKVNRFGQIGKFEVNDMHKAIDVIWHELNFDENTDAFKVKTEFKIYSMNFVTNISIQNIRFKLLNLVTDLIELIITIIKREGD